jgi:CPA2 family monovalent cation:H+ antiporter-2
MEKRAVCSHVIEIVDVEPSSPDGCPECLALGDSWVHLRICLTCGHVGCCDNSKNRHARRHFHEASHSVIQSYEPGEAWRYCYTDDVVLPEGTPFRSRQA